MIPFTVGRRIQDVQGELRLSNAPRAFNHLDPHQDQAVQI